MHTHQDFSDLSVVIPSYNARALLRRALRTLQIAAPGAEVIVVDGASADRSAEMVRDEFPDVQVLEYPNHGFAHATNRGIEATTREFVLFLNSDVFVNRAAIESMLRRVRMPNFTKGSVGAVAPVLLNEDGSRQRAFGFYYWPNWLTIRRPTRVPWLSAACLLTRRDVLVEVGGIDETFFLYNEEYDWCARLSDAGYAMEMVPEGVVHIGGGSTTRSPELLLEEQRGFLYLSSKHAPSIVTKALCLSMRFQGFCYSRIDPRARWRSMWSQLESLTERESFRESPFPLSGRGEDCTRSGWIPANPPPIRAPQNVQPLRPTAVERNATKTVPERRSAARLSIAR